MCIFAFPGDYVLALYRGVCFDLPRQHGNEIVEETTVHKLLATDEIASVLMDTSCLGNTLFSFVLKDTPVSRIKSSLLLNKYSVYLIV